MSKKEFYYKQFSSAYKIVIFQTIQFSISTQFSSILPIHRTLSGATTSGQSGLSSVINEGVLHLPQSSCITGTNLTIRLYSVISRKLFMWWGLNFCREGIGVFFGSSQFGNSFHDNEKSS